MGSAETRDAPINGFKEHLHKHAEAEERQKREIKAKKLRKKAAKARSKKLTVVEDGDMPECEDISGWDEAKERLLEKIRNDPRMRARDIEAKFPDGCCSSITVALHIDGGLPALAMTLLDLSDADLKKHWQLFSVAAGEDKQISHDEFFNLLDVDPTPFLKSLVDAIVFDWADLDKDDTLSFSEFLLTACIVCTLTQRQLIYFIFALFDTDDDEFLDYRELQAIEEAMESSRFGGTNAKFIEVCNHIQMEHHNKQVLEARKMKFDGFLDACHRCPLIVHPIQRLQEALRERTLGTRHWLKLRDTFDAGRGGDAGDFHHEMSGAGLLLLEENQHGGRPRRTTGPRRRRGCGLGSSGGRRVRGDAAAATRIDGGEACPRRRRGRGADRRQEARRGRPRRERRRVTTRGEKTRINTGGGVLRADDGTMKMAPKLGRNS